MSFAAAEQRLNASVMRRMTNASALLAGGASFPVIFDDAYAGALGGLIASDSPVAQALVSDLEANAVAVNTGLAIRGTDYRVRELQPDGTGWCAMVLETA